MPVRLLRISMPLLGALLAVGTALADPSATQPPPSQPGAPAPHIQFEATDLDLGDVVQGQDAVAKFTYRNTGAVPLHIASAKPSCSCTVASFDEVVEPGQTGSLQASIHTANYKGQIAKTVTVNHDDPSQGPIVLSVKATVVGSVTILPYPSLTLAPRLKGFGRPATLIVRQDPTETGTLLVEDLATSVPWLNATARKVTAEELPDDGLPVALPGDYVISVLAKHAPVGSSAQNLSFKTGLTRTAQVTIPIMVTVRAPVVLQPSELILQPKPGASGSAMGQALAAVRDDLDPKTLVVTSSEEAFVARLEASGERAFRLTVEWTERGKKTPTAATIHLTASGESVDLPVRVNP